MFESLKSADLLYDIGLPTLLFSGGNNATWFKHFKKLPAVKKWPHFRATQHKYGHRKSKKKLKNYIFILYGVYEGDVQRRQPVIMTSVTVLL